MQLQVLDARIPEIAEFSLFIYFASDICYSFLKGRKSEFSLEILQS